MPPWWAVAPILFLRSWVPNQPWLARLLLGGIQKTAGPLGRLGGLGKAPHQLLQGALNTLEPLLDCRAQRHSGAVVKDGELQDTSPPPSEAVSCLPYKSQRTKPPPPSPWCCSQLNDLNSLTSMSNSGNWQIQGPAVEERTPTSPRKAGFNSSLTGA